jgi:hypothetical protein
LLTTLPKSYKKEMKLQSSTSWHRMVSETLWPTVFSDWETWILTGWVTARPNRFWPQ